MESAVIGLGVIVIAWILQVISSWRGKKEIKPSFLLIYALGAALLIIDGYVNDAKYLAILNLIALVGALLVLIKVSSKDSSGFTKKKKR